MGGTGFQPVPTILGSAAVSRSTLGATSALDLSTRFAARLAARKAPAGHRAVVFSTRSACGVYLFTEGGAGDPPAPPGDSPGGVVV
jgi:hypothetical protein